MLLSHDELPNRILLHNFREKFRRKEKEKKSKTDFSFQQNFFFLSFSSSLFISFSPKKPQTIFDNFYPSFSPYPLQRKKNKNARCFLLTSMATLHSFKET
jgi:hypothetical protein